MNSNIGAVKFVKKDINGKDDRFVLGVGQLYAAHLFDDVTLGKVLPLRGNFRSSKLFYFHSGEEKFFDHSRFYFDGISVFDKVEGYHVMVTGRSKETVSSKHKLSSTVEEFFRQK